MAKNKKNNLTNSITLCKRCDNPYLEPGKPILFWENADLSCGGLVMKYKTYYQFGHQFEFIYKYLKGKGLPMDVSGFSEKDLGGIVMDMQNNNRESISLKELIDIYSFENVIVSIRDHKIEKLGKYYYKN